MKKYLTSIWISFVLVLILAPNDLFSQVYIEQSGADLTEIDVTEYDMDLIMTTTTETLTKYSETATFLSPTGQFSEEKYADFLGLFSGGAKVFNDLVEKDGDNIDYAVYADNVYQFMQGTGVKFELSDVYLEKMKYDSGGFYIVTLSMEKLMLNGLNDNNVTTNYNNGVPVPLEMKIEMPDYDITQATIISILGEGARKKVKKDLWISAGLMANLGHVFATNNGANTGFELNKYHDFSYNSYGLQSLVKLSLNQSKTIWGIIGVQALFHNYRIDFNNYYGQAITNIPISYEVGGKSYIEETDNSGMFEKEVYNLTNAITYIDSLGRQEIFEKVTTIALELPIGIGWQIASNYDYDFFIDFCVVPYYSISTNGNVNSNEFDVVALPISENLTDEVAQVILNAANQEEDLRYSRQFNNKPTTAVSAFSVGAMISPSFQYKFNYRMALEIAGNLHYNFLPLYETGHKSGENIQQELVEYLTDNESTYTSTIQHYFTNVNVLRYGLKVGIVFKL